jgi:hypothetical protein
MRPRKPSDSAGPLFDLAEARAVAGMERAAGKAERKQFGWRANAVEAVRLYATTHAHFMAEDVLRVFPAPDDADARAFGAVMRDAAKAGFIVADGFAPAMTSNRSPKVRWASRVYVGSEQHA